MFYFFKSLVSLQYKSKRNSVVTSMMHLQLVSVLIYDNSWYTRPPSWFTLTVVLRCVALNQSHWDKHATTVRCTGECCTGRLWWMGAGGQDHVQNYCGNHLNAGVQRHGAHHRAVWRCPAGSSGGRGRLCFQRSSLAGESREACGFLLSDTSRTMFYSAIWNCVCVTEEAPLCFSLIVSLLRTDGNLHSAAELNGTEMKVQLSISIKHQLELLDSHLWRE